MTRILGLIRFPIVDHPERSNLAFGGKGPVRVCTEKLGDTKLCELRTIYGSDVLGASGRPKVHKTFRQLLEFDMKKIECPIEGTVIVAVFLVSRQGGSTKVNGVRRKDKVGYEDDLTLTMVARDEEVFWIRNDVDKDYDESSKGGDLTYGALCSRFPITLVWLLSLKMRIICQ
ncbi:hypothetical protein Tco_0379483 [Tanacetum coccineum]